MASRALKNQQVATRARARYTFDGEPMDLADFLRNNREDRRSVAQVLALAPGETVVLGGGAWASFEVKRLE